MVSNLEVNYKEITSNKNQDSQDYLEVLFITADKLRESIDAATTNIIRDATEEDVKLKEISISDGRMSLILEINRKPNRLQINHVSTLTLLYEGPEDAQRIAENVWVE